MQISSSISSIYKIVNIYKEFLSSVCEEEFQKKPSPDAWSYSEIYFHIFDSSLLSVKAIKAINMGVDEGGSTKFISWAILFFGRFPPVVKLKAPKSILARVKSISMVEANQLIDSFETKLTFTLKLVDLNSTGRVNHPRLGALTTKQWLKFIEIHLKHHLKQVERTKSSF